MSDRIISLKMLLMATHPDIDWSERPKDDLYAKFPMLKDLEDYINSPEYRQLIIDERKKARPSA